MLQRISERIKGWVAGVIIAVVALAFMLFGVEYYFQSGAVNSNVAATVNGTKITDQQVQQMSERIAKQELPGKPITSALQKELNAYALQSLVTNAALLTTAQKEGFRVSEQAVKAMIARVPQFQQNGQFSKTLFMETLYRMGVSPEQFFHRLQSEWLLNQITAGVTASAFSLPNEEAHLYALIHQQRAFGYLLIPIKNFAAKVQLKPQAALHFYQQNKRLFQMPATVSVNYIELSPSMIAKTVTITAAKAKQYYESNIINYQIPKRWKVAQITVTVAPKASANAIKKAQARAANLSAKFQKGDSFQKIMKAKQAGLVSSTSIMSATQLNEQLRAALTALGKGNVSKPVRTTAGFTLFKVLAVYPAKTKTFSSVQHNIMALLKRQEINKILTKKSSQLEDLSYTNPSSLKVAAKKLGLTIQTSKMMTKAGEKKGIFSNQKVMSAVFSESVFHEGNNSNPIDLENGSQVVVRIHKKIPSQLISFEKEQAKIKQMLIQKQAKGHAGLLAYQLQTQIQKGAHPSQLAAKHGLRWVNVPFTVQQAKSTPTLPSTVLATAFSTPVSAAKATGKPVGTNTVLLSNGDYAVIAIMQVKNANSKKASAKTQAMLRLKLSNLWGKLLQQFYVGSVVSASKVVMKKDTSS